MNKSKQYYLFIMLDIDDFLKISYGINKPDQFTHKMSYRELKTYCGFSNTINYVNIEFINMCSAKTYWNYKRKDILNKIYEEIKFILNNLFTNLKGLKFIGFEGVYFNQFNYAVDKYINLESNNKLILPESLRYLDISGLNIINIDHITINNLTTFIYDNTPLMRKIKYKYNGSLDNYCNRYKNSAIKIEIWFLECKYNPKYKYCQSKIINDYNKLYDN